MATSKKDKEQAKPNKAIKAANDKALNKFPRAKLKAAYDSMAELASDADKANETRQAAALDVVKLAHQFQQDNSEATLETVVDGWRSNLKTVIMELAVAGNRFAELKESKGDNPATAKLTGYGNNVASIAKGCIEFEIEPLDSYRDTRKAVEAARHEHRRETNPDAAQLQDSREACDEAWKEVRKLAFDTGNAGLIDQVTAMLGDMKSDIEVALKHEAEQEAAAIEAENDAAEAEAKAA